MTLLPPATSPGRTTVRRHADGSRHSIATVHQARLLHQAGWTHTEIQRLIVKDGKPQPSLTAIKRWTNPRYADNQRKAVLAVRARRRAQTANFRLCGETSAYRDEFVRLLYREGVPAAEIVKVCHVVLAADLSHDQVQRTIGVAPPPQGKAATPLLDRIRQLRSAGMFFSQIAVLLHVDYDFEVTEGMVRYWLRVGREPKR